MCADDEPRKAGYPFVLLQVAAFNLLRLLFKTNLGTYIHFHLTKKKASNLIYAAEITLLYQQAACKLQHYFIVKKPE
jgi:hypothetical protein